MLIRVGPENIQKGVPWTLNSPILDTFIFLRQNSIKIIQNFKGKGVAASRSAHP